jgi:hypothetical protein
MSRIPGRRAASRVRLGIPAQVLLIQGLEKCMLDDLSQSGARVTIAAKLPVPGAGVILRARGLEVFGSVVWSQGARFGILFEEPLPLRDVVNLRHFADAYVDHERAIQRRNARSFVQGSPRLKRFS